MQVGDLVRYTRDIFPKQAIARRAIGIVVGFNEDSPVILWNCNLGIRTDNLIFVEVISENQ